MPATDEKYSKGKESFENFNPHEKNEDNLW